MTVIFAVSASAKNVGVTVTSQRYVPDQTNEKSVRKAKIIWRYVPYHKIEIGFVGSMGLNGYSILFEHSHG